MPIVINEINGGLQTDRTAFNINNDAFPKLVNAYQWRGRIKRKRGTSYLGRLNFYIGTTDSLGDFSYTINPTPVPVGVSQFTVGDTVFTDPGGPSPVNLLSTTFSTATLDRTTGIVSVSNANASTSVFYYPGLPVLGLESLQLTSSQFAGTLAFDSAYSYNIGTTFPYDITGTSFYNNPPSSGSYTQKTTWTPTSWNGLGFQQFWTVNYEGALWATNGITNSNSLNNIGMQFKNIVAITPSSATVASLEITAHGLVVGDFVFINEVAGTTGINFQTGYVTTVTDANNVIVTFPNSTISGNGTGGIAQYLTNRSDITVDCLRWYNGDPTNSDGVPAVTGAGWVNFMPPLSQDLYSIASLPAAQYYLAGARMILPFKDRLLFIGPVVQAGSSKFYLQDTVIYSQAGSPYYTASFSGSINSAATTFNPLLVPTGVTASPLSFFEDQNGFGGFVTAGYYQPILTASQNEDVLIFGFPNRQVRFVYTGNDLAPFQFFVINSELGSMSTFSSLTLDRGVVSIGPNGIIITSQVSAQRIDLQIPDQIFQFNLTLSATQDGRQSITSQRDYINEWIYFTYLSNDRTWAFPNQTLQYNYRDNSWAIFDESYTTYGTFRRQSGYTWSTIGTVFSTWEQWNEPWSSGSTTLFQPIVLGGNQQGFVLFRDDGTNEGSSLFIQDIVGSVISSPNHCLNNGDYIIINDCTGTVAAQVNGKIFSVMGATADTFTINPLIEGGPYTYTGMGTITRMYVPFIQTKQFTPSWSYGKKTRIGVQRYLLSTTNLGQITVLIFLSQDGDNAYNDLDFPYTSKIVPENSQNNALVYSSTLYTCPESTNLGLTPANTNLQMPTAVAQQQIWHRMNTSLLGDTIQLGFTLSDEQMRDEDFNSQFAEIELHAMVVNVSPSQDLA